MDLQFFRLLIKLIYINICNEHTCSHTALQHQQSVTNPLHINESSLWSFLPSFSVFNILCPLNALSIHMPPLHMFKPSPCLSNFLSKLLNLSYCSDVPEWTRSSSLVDSGHSQWHFLHVAPPVKPSVFLLMLLPPNHPWPMVSWPTIPSLTTIL